MPAWANPLTRTGLYSRPPALLRRAHRATKDGVSAHAGNDPISQNRHSKPLLRGAAPRARKGRHGGEYANGATLVAGLFLTLLVLSAPDFVTVHLECCDSSRARGPGQRAARSIRA